ncbi:MAG: lytic transglycosylase domain-containing protein [Phenylobacterium sp.]
MSGRVEIARISGACLALALLSAGAPAAAQVIAIDPDGGVVTYAGPAVYSNDGVRSLTPQAERAPAPAPADVVQAIQESSTRHAMSAPLVEAVAWQESRFNQAAVSPKGARGVMQLMPETARRLGVDPSDARGNIEGGVTYLAQMLARFGGDLSLALAAYNAGPDAVARYGGVPPFPETRAYVRSIIGRLGAAAPAVSHAE